MQQIQRVSEKLNHKVMAPLRKYQRKTNRQSTEQTVHLSISEFVGRRGLVEVERHSYTWRADDILVWVRLDRPIAGSVLSQLRSGLAKRMRALLPLEQPFHDWLVVIECDGQTLSRIDWHESGEPLETASHYADRAPSKQFRTSLPTEYFNPNWESLQSHILGNAELVRKVANAQLGVTLQYDETGVRWLDEYIERNKYARSSQGEIAKCLGCFLGECFRQTFGGSWIEDPDFGWILKINNDVSVHPLNKITQHLSNEDASSVLDLFMTIPAMLESSSRQSNGNVERRSCWKF